MSEPDRVGLVGDGPAAVAVRAALSDADVTVEDVDPTSPADLLVVVGPAGAPPFGRAHESGPDRWMAVELGGVGGRAIETVDAAVSVLGPTGGCYDCLRLRVRSNADGRAPGTPSTTRADARLAGAIAGRLAVSQLGGDDVTGRVVELPYVERRLLPVPTCGCGRDPRSDPDVPRTTDDLPLEAVVDRMEGAIDSRVGVVREVGEAHSFPAPYYLATLADTSAFSDAEAGPQAAGVAVDWNPAFVKAIGEAAERYAAGCYRASASPTAPAGDRDDRVPPSAFVLPPGYDDPDPTEAIPWYPGEALATGEPVDLPAEFVLFPPPERRHKPAITTGLGLGTDGVGALLSGLYEVVERDAAMLSWYSTFEPLGLAVDDSTFDLLVRRARAEDLAVTPLLVTQDVDVPVVTVAVHREGEWPRLAVGSAADLDAEAAAVGAAEEALQNWMELRAMGRERAADAGGAIGRYAAFPDEVASFVEPATTVPARDVGPEEAPMDTDALAALLERLDAVGLEAFAARLTTRDVAQLGLEVVRVLVPDAQPLFTGETFFGERARAVPAELGFSPRLDGPPHPYP